MECGQQFGCEILCGPLHSAIGVFSGTGPTEGEFKYGVETLQRAAEKAEWGHGAFTRCLLQALAGGSGAGSAGSSRDADARSPKAGTSGARAVTFDEVVRYVKDAVAKLTGGEQTPTAAPDEIIPFTAIPITRKR